MPSKPAAKSAPMPVSDDEIGASDQEIAKSGPPKINRTVIKKTVKKAVPVAKKKTATSRTKKTAESEVDKEGAVKSAVEASDADEPEEMEAKPKSRKTKTTKKDAPVEEEKETVAPVRKTQKVAKPKAADEQPAESKPARKTKTKRAPSPEPPAPVIPETQQDPSEVSHSVEEDHAAVDAMDVDREPPPPAPVPKRSHHRARSISQQRQQAPGAVYSRARSTSQQPGAYSRGRSASDTERRVGETEAKRKLADMTKKYEDLRLKYDSLIDLGSKTAEANFERLKKASDHKAKDAHDLIASLKKELSDLRKTSSTNVSESAHLKSQVAALQTANENLTSESKTIQSHLLESQNECKALTAKLEAARKSAAQTDKVPGSAVKKNDHSKNNMVGGTPEAVKEAALKEELYRDLTGLIVNSVKRRDGEDEYSCIQTGRNGTLHFHLTIATDETIQNPKTPSGLSYEETEFAYEPLLDESRDRELMDLLPDYLTEEICFPRNHAVKFYTKVVESMTRRVVLDEE